ncbi:MAG: EF-hand domain-containing protein [Burkholderiales bacterium]
MNTSSYRRTALALALCALTGVAFAQSSSGSGGTSGGATSGGSSSPSSTSPMNSGTGSGTTGSGSMGSGSTGSGHYPSSSPSAGQMSPGGQPMSNGMRSPSRTDSADAAYRSLDSSNRGYLQKSDVQGLSGFNFDQADTNHDGRLTKDEFSKAWSTTK